MWRITIILHHFAKNFFGLNASGPSYLLLLVWSVGKLSVSPDMTDRQAPLF